MSARLVFLFFFIPILSYSQEYYSKTYLFDEYSTALVVRDFVIEEDTIITCTGLTCFNGDSICTGIVKINQSGDIIDTLIFPFTSGNQQSMIVEEDRYIFSGRNPFNNQVTLENSIVDRNNGLVEIRSKPQSLHTRVLNEGIIGVGQKYFSFGDATNISDPSCAEAYIIKWNNSLDSVENHMIVSENAKESHVFDLQESSDGHLVYMNYVEFHNVIEDYDYHFFIKKMDINGGDIRQFYHGESDYRGHFPCLLAHSNNKYYFSSTTSTGEFEGKLYNMIHCVDSNLEHFEWSVDLPHFDSDTKRDWVQYYVADITEARNGDLLICGDMIDTDTINDQRIGYETAFMMRMDSQTGEVDWTRRLFYNKQERETRLDSEPFRIAWLSKIKEDEHGNIIAMGQQLRGYDTISYNDLLLVKLDADGCFGNEDEDCQEYVFVNNEEVPIISDRNNLYPFPNPVTDKLFVGHIPFESFKIISGSGNMIKNGKHQLEIDLRDVESGSYFLVLIDRQGYSENYKINKL